MTFKDFLKDSEEYLSKEDTFKIRPSSEFKQKYQTIKRIGNGAFAEVFLTKEKETGELYASKLIDRTRISTPKHLWSEIHILYNLEHPSIIQLKEVYANKTHVMMILEYAKGGELLDYLEKLENYSEEDAKKIIHDLLVAIVYLHKKRVVHRDIKPENILFFDEEATIMKLSDFGLSGVLKENCLLSTCAGTPGFMAPEIIKGNGHGFECDMWSIGVLTYFLLSGSLPFNSPVPFTLYQSILNAEYEFGSEFDSVSDDAKDFITKCICVDTKKRLTPTNAMKHPWIHPPEPVMQLEVKERAFNLELELMDEENNDEMTQHDSNEPVQENANEGIALLSLDRSEPILQQPQPKHELTGVKGKIIAELRKRRQMKLYKATNTAITAISKLKLKAKAARDKLVNNEENTLVDDNPILPPRPSTTETSLASRTKQLFKS